MNIKWIKIEGRPKSSQGHSRKEYLLRAATAGRAIFDTPFKGEITVVVLYVLERREGEEPDLDNLTKVLLDALKGMAYADDQQVNPMRVERFYCGEPVVTSAPMLPSDAVQQSAEIAREECTYIGIADSRL